MRIYIAGPITGIPDYAERFAKAAKEIEATGHVAVNPATTGDPSDNSGNTWHYYMRRALFLMLTCDAVLFLPGWENSRGATFERNVAEMVGMTMFADLNTLRTFADSIAPAALGDVDTDVDWAIRFDDGELDNGYDEKDARNQFAYYAPRENAKDLGYAKDLLRRTVITIHYPWEGVESR